MARSNTDVPFHVPSLGPEDHEAALEVLREGWITTGPRCKEFERQFGEFIGDGDGELHCIAVNSGTAALHLALEAAGIGPGDRVVVPVWTFTASAEVVRYLGADPLFADVSATDFCMRPADVLAAVETLGPSERESVKAVLPVHFGGLACDMPALEKLCSEQGWALIDDAAHSLPTKCAGKWIGNYGDATAFSFYATKTLCTGEGGMVVTRDAGLAERMRIMRLHGISKDAFDRYRSTEPAWYYEIVAPGFKYNLGDLAAAIGLCQLRKQEEFLAARARIASKYSKAFAAHDGLTVPPDAPASDVHSWHLYALRVAGGREVRDATIAELAKAQIATSVHFIPLHMHPYWRERYHLAEDAFPVAKQLFSQEISLPIFPSMTDTQIECVIDTLPTAYARALESVGG